MNASWPSAMLPVCGSSPGTGRARGEARGGRRLDIHRTAKTMADMLAFTVALWKVNAGQKASALR